VHERIPTRDGFVVDERHETLGGPREGAVGGEEGAGTDEAYDGAGDVLGGGEHEGGEVDGSIEAEGAGDAVDPEVEKVTDTGLPRVDDIAGAARTFCEGLKYGSTFSPVNIQKMTVSRIVFFGIDHPS